MKCPKCESGNIHTARFCSNSATLILFLNGSEEEIIITNDGEFLHDFPLRKGTNRISAKVKDPAGNQSVETDVIKIEYDNLAPSLSINAPSDGDEFYGSDERQVVITGTTDENTDIEINGRLVDVDSDGEFTYLTTLSEGDNEFTIVAIDKADNDKEEKLILKFSE